MKCCFVEIDSRLLVSLSSLAIESHSFMHMCVVCTYAQSYVHMWVESSFWLFCHGGDFSCDEVIMFLKQQKGWNSQCRCITGFLWRLPLYRVMHSPEAVVHSLENRETNIEHMFLNCINMINLYLALALTVILYHTVRIKLLSGISNLESNIMILLKSFSLSCLGLYTSVLLFRVFMYVAVL